jgi:hypothetical protein
MKGIKSIAIVLLALLLVSFCPISIISSQPEGISEYKEGSRVIHQLRIYEIFDNTRLEFHNRFRHHAMES